MAKRPLSRVQVARARAAELKAAKARAVRAQRISERLKLGPLRDRVVSAVTLKRYKGSVKEFFRWCRIHGYRTPSSTEDFDMLITAYAEMLWCEGDPRTVLAYTLAGFSHLVPSLRHRLNGSWRVYVAWGKSEPAQQAPPLTRFMTQAIAGWFISEGLCGAGLGILLAFNCILRTGELFELLKKDFTLGARSLLILLRDTKVGVRFGYLQETFCKDKWLVCKLVKFLRSLQNGDKLIQMLPARFRKLWALALKACGIDKKYKPYSLRRGGATALFAHSGQYDKVMERGRWQTLESMKMYINTAMQELASVDERDALHPVLQDYVSKLNLA